MIPLDRRSVLLTLSAGALLVSIAMASPPGPARPGTTVAAPPSPAPELRRGPYLQAAGPDRVVVRWRTRGATGGSGLRLGTSPERLDQVVTARRVCDGLPDVEDWEAVAAGLLPAHTYYYAVESSKVILAGLDDAHRFQTAPPPGRPAPARFWVLGDCGTNRAETGNPGKSLAARNGFRRFNQGRGPVDGILLLGDNAYSHGTDSQYQTALFTVYRDELRNTPLWPCIGNHELTNDYFGIFTVPEAAEAGGVPSHCPNYYSFDHANIHFVVLDLWKSEWGEPTAPQRRWLEADLAATRQDWVVVANHFPPYCDGKYESDHNGYLVEVREKILPVLEGHGVDLLLCGHDHTYQRSYLLDGHHGTRETFDPLRHCKAAGDGRTTPLTKVQGPHSGLIVVVTGTAGAPQTASPTDTQGPHLSHPAMVKLPGGDQSGHGVRRLGTFLLEVDGLTLTGTQVDDRAQVVDRFTLVKTLSASHQVRPGR